MHYDMCGDHLNLSVNDFYAKCIKCCARRLCTAASELVSGVGRGHAHGACRAGSPGAGVAGRESVGATPSGSASGWDVHSGATCGDTHVQWSGAGQWLEGVRYGFLKNKEAHGKKKSGLGWKKVPTFCGFGVGDKAAAGVMGAEAVLAESSAMFTDRGAS